MPSMLNKQPLVVTGTALEAPFCRGNPATALLRECFAPARVSYLLAKHGDRAGAIYSCGQPENHRWV